MFVYSSDKVIGNTNIKNRMILVGEDVNVLLLHNKIILIKRNKRKKTPRFVRSDIKARLGATSPTLSCRAIARHPSLRSGRRPQGETPHLRSGRQKGEIRGDKKKAFGEIKEGVLGDKKGGRGHRDRGGSR